MCHVVLCMCVSDIIAAPIMWTILYFSGQADYDYCWEAYFMCIISFFSHSSYDYFIGYYQMLFCFMFIENYISHFNLRIITFSYWWMAILISNQCIHCFHFYIVVYTYMFHNT